VVVAAALWGLWPVWVRGAVGGARAAAIALLVAGVLGAPLALGSRRRAGPVSRGRRDWCLLVALGVANALNTWLYFRALTEGPVAAGAISHYLAPVLIAVLAPIVLHEPASRRTPLALVLALSGTAVLLFSRGGGEGSVAHGVSLGGASAIFYATTVLISKKIGGRFTDLEMFSYHALVASVVLVPLAGLPSEAELWLRPAAGGVVSGLVAGTVYYAGLRRIPAERVAVLTYTEVVAAMLVAWALGQPPGLAAALGGVLVVTGGLLVVSADPG